MQFLHFILNTLLLAITVHAQQQPCYNHADPDNGIENYCQCADNLCYYDSGSSGCNPPGNMQITCPEGRRRGSVKVF
ncbi:unnamed protein product [Cercospora beticola]|nr:unnamed protein product [Cercospora beticola]